MKKYPIAFSISVSVILSALTGGLILYFIFKNWGDITAVKDSLSIISGIFGGLATLGAALIAANLFNDWRDQHNKSVKNQFSIETYNKFSEFEQSITLCTFEVEKLKASISDAEYSIPTDTLRYLECLPLIEEIFTKIKLVKLNFSDYLSKQRAYGAVTGQVEKTKENLKIYLEEFNNINKNDPSNIDDVQTLVKEVTQETIKYSELSTKIYISSIQEMLIQLRVYE